jgi:hypothetical protein
MDTQAPLPGENGSNTGGLAGATRNMAIIATQHEHSHKLAHCDAANAATKHMTQDAHLNIMGKTGSCKHKKQSTVRGEYIYIDVNSGQLTI